MYRDIADIIKNIKCDSVMDIGCMKGQLLEQLDNLNYYCGLEISEEFGIISCISGGIIGSLSGRIIGLKK